MIKASSTLQNQLCQTTIMDPHRHHDPSKPLVLFKCRPKDFAKEATALAKGIDEDIKDKHNYRQVS